MSKPPLSVHPWAEAMNWLSRISAAVIFMLGAGFGGIWLDNRLGTSFLAVAGFVVGSVVGLAYLLRLASSSNRHPNGGARRPADHDGSGDRE